MKASILGVVLDCKDADSLANFYAQVFNWEKTVSADGWAAIQTPQGIVLAFQSSEEYNPPVWPSTTHNQQQMTHIDFKVHNLSEAVDHAIACGAKKSSQQYFDTSVVLFDPAGHPFCLVQSEE